MRDETPQHIAIIMDGNGRWAKKKNLLRPAGHRAGLVAVRRVVEACLKHHIPILTLFAFGQENWRRPSEEISALMALFLRALQREVKKLHENNVCLKVLGDKQAFSSKIRSSIEKAEQLTAHNTGLRLNIAANYSGRWDLTHAVQQLLSEIQSGSLSLAAIDETAIEQRLATTDLPPPDLFIRTSGEQRLSNFLLWQAAYSELYFTETYWPDFGEESLLAAIADFKTRQRRFGYTDEQLHLLQEKKPC